MAILDDEARLAVCASIDLNPRVAAMQEASEHISIEDHRGLDSAREGMLEGFTLGDDLHLAESTGRLIRAGKASTSGELVGVFARLGIDAESWSVRMRKRGGGQLLGRYFTASRTRLREVAGRLGRHLLANLRGCPAGS